MPLEIFQLHGVPPLRGWVCFTALGGVWWRACARWHRPSFCVAGVALLALVWLWWCAWSALVPFDAVGLFVASVALGDIDGAFLSYTSLSHTTLPHISLTYYFVTRDFVTHNSFAQLFHLLLFNFFDPPPSPLFFLPSPYHFNHCFWSLEEVDLWGYVMRSFTSHFDFDMCFAPQQRALLNISILISKRALKMVCFAHFCFVPQRCALFQHLNVQKCSEPALFFTFWLRHVLRATTACNNFPLSWPRGSTPAASASLLFDPPEPQNIGKNTVFRDFLPFRAPGSSFFWHFLFSDLLSSSFPSWLSHLCFSFHICPQYCRKFDVKLPPNSSRMSKIDVRFKMLQSCDVRSTDVKSARNYREGAGITFGRWGRKKAHRTVARARFAVRNVEKLRG